MQQTHRAPWFAFKDDDVSSPESDSSISDSDTDSDMSWKCASSSTPCDLSTESSSDEQENVSDIDHEAPSENRDFYSQHNVSITAESHSVNKQPGSVKLYEVIKTYY